MLDSITLTSLLCVCVMTNFTSMTEVKDPANGKHFSLHSVCNPQAMLFSGSLLDRVWEFCLQVGAWWS